MIGFELQFGIILVSVIYEMKFHLEAVILPHMLCNLIFLYRNLLNIILCEMTGQT
jgi:hypothetical protein